MSCMHTTAAVVMAGALTVSALACARSEPGTERAGAGTVADVAARLAQYREVTLSADLSGLSNRQQQMIRLLIDAADVMNELFWQQAYGDPGPLLAGVDDAAVRAFLQLNFGPWDRLAGDEPFLPGVGPKPAGANLYPNDVTVQEIEQAGDPALTDLYTLVRRDESGHLYSVPYHEVFAEPLGRAADALRQAAQLAEDEGFRHYLTLRADALQSDRYRDSDLAWMDMKDNLIDLVIGPIETYEDQLLGAKASYEAYVLLKDKSWSERLARYAKFLPELQQGLPVPAQYKNEEPGTDAELNAYDLLFTAGEANSGSKTIAINLPNDERVQLQKGTRRIQIKNAMRAKFETILEPLAEELIDPEQRPHVTFDAFFANTMFHEVAHGLGIKNTIDGSGTVRAAMREQASWLEEGKADVLGLYMITALHDQGQIEGDLLDYYTTFFASIFRSIRFGATSAHGRANLVRFNFFKDMGAFERDADSGRYRIDMERMQQAVRALSEQILRFQGDGDRDGAAAFHDRLAMIGPDLQQALDRVASKGIPVDLVYRQGKDILFP